MAKRKKRRPFEKYQTRGGKWRLSPSALNKYVACRKCFFVDIMEGVSVPRGPFPSLPSGMDLVLKEHYDGFRGSDTLPPGIEEKVEARLMDGDVPRVMVYSRKLRKREGPIARIEHWRDMQGVVFFDDDGNSVRGGLDDVLELPDGSFAVLDYKTRGFPVKENSHIYYVLQMSCYRAGLEQLAEREKRKAGLSKLPFEVYDKALLTFYSPDHFEDTGKLIQRTEPVWVDTDVKEARRVFGHAVRLLGKGTLPTPRKGCNTCDYRKKVAAVERRYARY